MIVNNGLDHDSRVIKSAVTLARAGAEVDVFGVAPDGRVAVVEGNPRYTRLAMLPARAVTPAYARWALRRRAGRLAPARSWRRSMPVTGYYRRAFLPALRALRPDAVHVHDVHLLAVATEYAGESRAAVVYDAHEYVPGLSRTPRVVTAWSALEAAHIHAADRVITVSDAIADRLQQHYALVRRPSVVYNAPIAGDFPASRSLRGRVPAGAPLAVYAGALSAARGVQTAIAALAQLPDVHLAVVTVPFPHKMAGHLRAVADQAGVADRLHIVAPVPTVEVPDYLSSADAALLPLAGESQSYQLALPNKLFEYLHAGLPVVTSDCRAMAAFVAEHDIGVSFPAGDAAALADALRDVLARREWPDTTALRARFSWQGQQPALVAAYHGIVDGLRPAGDGWSSADFALDWAPSHTRSAQGKAPVSR